MSVIDERMSTIDANRFSNKVQKNHIELEIPPLLGFK